MKLNNLLAFILFSINLSSQNVSYPIFDFKGDSVGYMENGRTPIQIGGNKIDIGRFYEIQVNLEANRIYALELQAAGMCTVPCQKYLKIFDLIGNLIYSDPYRKPIVCSYDKLFSIAENGDVAFCNLKKEQDDKSVYEIVRLDRNGKEIFRKEIIVKAKSRQVSAFFDANSKGEFLISFHIWDRGILAEKIVLKKFNEKGKRVWKKILNLKLIDVSINEKGQAALLVRPIKGDDYSQSIILISSTGKRTFNINAEAYFGKIDFKNDFTLSLRQQFHYQSHRRKTIEIKKLKAKQF